MLCKPLEPDERNILKGFCYWHCSESLSASVFLPVNISLSPPLLCPFPSPCLSFCASVASIASPRRKRNEREKRIHYGLVLRCSPQPFSCLDLWALLYIDAPVGRGEAFHSHCLSALRISAGKKMNYKKKKEEAKGGLEKTEKYSKNESDWEAIGVFTIL